VNTRSIPIEKTSAKFSPKKGRKKVENNQYEKNLQINSVENHYSSKDGNKSLIFYFFLFVLMNLCSFTRDK
jgi:hypothetical protein